MSKSPLLSVIPEQARQWQWADDILPLAKDRYPFRPNGNEAVLRYLQFLEVFPEAYGRLGRFVRARLGIEQPCPTQFVFREAHIDISDADGELADRLLGLGFEPDHFLSLNPPEYTQCFTARFEIPVDRRERSQVIAKYLLKIMQEAEQAVLMKKGRFAYSEIECYTHRDKRTFAFCPTTEESLQAFPFQKGAFQMIAGYPKKWDVHVKIPTAAKGPTFAAADSSPMLILRQLFMQAGFYEIRSLSGNLIYTLQMVDGRQAKLAFFALESWAQKFGGVTSIEMEACTRFWRSEEELRGFKFVAPIPKVVAATPEFPD